MYSLLITCTFEHIEPAHVTPDLGTVKPGLCGHSRKIPKLVFKTYYRLMRSKVFQNAPREHSAILSTFNKLPFAFLTFVCLFLSGCLRQVLLYLSQCARKPSLKAHTEVSSRARGLIFGVSLPLLLYFEYVRSQGSEETVHMHRHIRPFVACRCDI